jgi:hypothetical protein
MPNFKAKKFTKKIYLKSTDIGSCGNVFTAARKYTQKKEIHNLPTCVVVGNNWGNHFIATNFNTLPMVEKLSIYHEMFGTTCTKNKSTFINRKDYNITQLLG